MAAAGPLVLPLDAAGSAWEGFVPLAAGGDDWLRLELEGEEHGGEGGALGGSTGPARPAAPRTPPSLAGARLTLGAQLQACLAVRAGYDGPDGGLGGGVGGLGGRQAATHRVFAPLPTTWPARAGTHPFSPSLLGPGGRGRRPPA